MKEQSYIWQQKQSVYNEVIITIYTEQFNLIRNKLRE